MTASPSPGNDNIILLVALGVAAYWFMTQKARATPVYIQPGAGAAQTNGGAVTGQLISTGGNLLGQLIGRFTGGKASAGSSYGGQQDLYPVNAAPVGYDPMTNDLSGYNETTFGGIGIE